MDKYLRGGAAVVTGIASTLIGTLLAVLTIPENPAVAGALVVPATLLAAGILLVPALRALSGTSDMLRAENFVALGFVYWLLVEPIQGGYDLPGVSDESIRSALIATGLAAAAMWVGMIARPWRLPSWFSVVVARPLKTETVLKLIPACFLLGMSNYIYSTNFDLVEMFSYLGANRWSAPWSRGQFGGWGAFLEHTEYFGYVVPSLALLLVARRGWLKLECVLAVTAAVIMVLFLAQGGGRRILGITVGAAIIVWALAQPQIRLRTVLGVVASTAVLIIGMQFLLEIRSQGLVESLERGRAYEYLHIDHNFLRLAQIIEIVPARHPFVHFQPLLYALVRPIPRVFWEGKPTDPGFDLPAALGLSDVSLTSSILGEWYLCFGWITVAIGGWLHGRMASAVNALVEGQVLASNPIVFALAVMVLVAGLRSMLDLIIMSYAVLAWFAISWFASDRRSSRARI